MGNRGANGAANGVTSPPVGELHEVDGRRLLLHKAGQGIPTAVFLAGGGAVGLDYLDIQQRVAAVTTSVLYDRGGTGWSDTVKLPRSLRQVTDELRDLLSSAGSGPPVLLVGHSLGGLYARHYAQRFPDEVAGLLLLDPAHEDYDAYMPQQLNEMRESGSARERPFGSVIRPVVSFGKKQLGRLVSVGVPAALRIGVTRSLLERVPPIRRYRELYRRLFAELMSEWPEDVREALIERHVSLEWLWTGIQEVQNVSQLYDEVRDNGPMPDVPLIVLSSTDVDEFRRAVSAGQPELLLRQEIEGKQRLYEAFAESVPRGEVRLVDGGHFTLHFRSQDAILRAVQDLIVNASLVERSVRRAPD